MGRRGPAPKPTVLRVLEGNPGKRPLNKREPKPRIRTPKAPAYLDLYAKAHWDELIPELEHIPGLLTAVDGGMLTLLCQTYSEWRMADEIIQRDGLTVETKGGTWARPEVKIRDSASKRYRAMAAEFGLTPSSRSRISLGSAQDNADDDGILS